MSAHAQRAGQTDVNVFLGPYPFRHVPHPDAASLLAVMKREGISKALVGHLPAPWYRTCDASNAELLKLVAPHRGILFPVPAVNPAWPSWETDVALLARQGAVALRVYPTHWALSEAGLRALADVAARAGLPILLTTKFEDSRQRHSLDTAPEVSAAVVRTLARSAAGARVILTCAGRSLIEEIHWSLTPAERARVWYDISWIWGPPHDDLAHLFASMGAQRFLFGTMWPLRLAQAPTANLELLPEDVAGAELADAGTVFPGL